MKAFGLQGVRRGKVKRTTIADPAAARANDLLGRRFGPLAPNVLWAADIKCRRRHLMSYADPRNMPMTSVMVHSDNAFGVVWSA
jgi:transposase InsO family protein